MNTHSIRFRPVSAEDFTRYARNLGRLLEEPLQRAQDLLARIYGYADVHELHRAMGAPGLPGPFDDDGAVGENGSIDMELFSTQIDRRSDRENRTFEILSHALAGRDDRAMKRCWAALEIGLFCQPSEHRRRFAAYTRKRAAADGSLKAAAQLSDYVVADVRDDGEVWAAFTPLGGAVFEAVSDLLPDEEASEDELDRTEERVLAIAAEHRVNPWPYAMYVTHFAWRYSQSTWDEYATADVIDAPADLPEHAAVFARNHLARVRRNIEQFESLFGRDAPIPYPKTSSAGVPDGSDAWFYPSMLFWGGRIAQNAGDLRTAATWYRRLLSRVERDLFGARFHLAELRLAAGRGAIRKLFTYEGEVQTTTPAAALACAAESLLKGDPARAREDLASGFEWSWSLLEAFGPKVESRQRLFTPMDGKGPATVREFLFRTQDFWNRSPEVVRFFADICSRPSVRRAVIELHEYEASRKRRASGLPDDFAIYPKVRSRHVAAIRTAMMEGAS